MLHSTLLPFQLEREKLDYAGHTGKAGLLFRQAKEKQVVKLEAEEKLEQEEGQSLMEDVELPIKLLSGWDGDATAPDCGSGSGSGRGSGTGEKEAADAEAYGRSGAGDDVSAARTILELRNVAFGYPSAAPQTAGGRTGENVQATEAAAAVSTPASAPQPPQPPPGPVLFHGCSFSVHSKSRIVLLGENGNGKTTLVKLLNGELTPTEGSIDRAPDCRVAMVTQHHADQLDLSLTPLAFMKKRS